MEKLRDMGRATGEWNSSPWGHHTASNTEESKGIRNKSRKGFLGRNNEFKKKWSQSEIWCQNWERGDNTKPYYDEGEIVTL